MNDLFCCKDIYAPLEGDDAKPKDMSDGSGRSLTIRLLGLFGNGWMIFFLS